MRPQASRSQQPAYSAPLPPPPPQIWDSLTGKLRKDLSYQAEEMFMMHEEAVLSCAWSRDSEVLATGGWQGWAAHTTTPGSLAALVLSCCAGA